MRRALGAAALVVASLGWAAEPAGANHTITIRKVDTSGYPTVTISAQVSGPTPGLNQFSLRENGRILTDIDVVPIGQTDTPIGIVLLVDVSGSMRTGNKIGAAKEAAKQFVAQKLPNDQVAVVAFSDQPRLVSGFTADGAHLTQAIDGLAATGETALFDGVRTAAGLLGERAELQPNVVLLSDGADTVSQADVAGAEQSLVGAKATLFAIGLRGGEFDAGSLQRLTQATGGLYAETTDPRALGTLYSSVQRVLQSQYEISYASSARGPIDISLAVADSRTTASAVIGAVAEGRRALQPEVVERSPFAGALSGGTGLWAAGAIAFVAVGLLVIGVIALARRESPRLRETLEPYEVEGGEPAKPGRRRRYGADVELAETALVKRAVEATARLARKRGVLQVVERKLEQADVPLRPAEALFFYLVALAAALALAGTLRGPVGLALAGVVVGLGPWATLDFLGGRRRRRFNAQLPDTLQLLASSLRAGYSLLQGADAVAEQVDDPMGKELRRVLVEARLGRPIEEALEDAAKRVQSPDFEWAVMAIRIQREVGGNLAELLQTVAETMLARERLRREIRALTAEGRISAIILALLPVGIGLFIYTTNPDYLDPLFEETIGKVMLIGGTLAVVVGFYWMKKIIEIEV